MKIYAIRDRLIDYYMTPFCAESDRQVMASLSTNISNPENLNAIAQCPQHFELYRLAEVDEETGNLTAKKEFLGDLTSFVRPGIRATREPGTDKGPADAGRHQGPPGRLAGDTSAESRPAQGPPPATRSAAEGPHPAHRGVPSN